MLQLSHPRSVPFTQGACPFLAHQGQGCLLWQGSGFPVPFVLRRRSQEWLGLWTLLGMASFSPRLKKGALEAAECPDHKPPSMPH